jgi:hypothetical protein
MRIRFNLRRVYPRARGYFGTPIDGYLRGDTAATIAAKRDIGITTFVRLLGRLSNPDGA